MPPRLIEDGVGIRIVREPFGHVFTYLAPSDMGDDAEREYFRTGFATHGLVDAIVELKRLGCIAKFPKMSFFRYEELVKTHGDWSELAAKLRATPKFSWDKHADDIGHAFNEHRLRVLATCSTALRRIRVRGGMNVMAHPLFESHGCAVWVAPDTDSLPQNMSYGTRLSAPMVFVSTKFGADAVWTMAKVGQLTRGITGPHPRIAPFYLYELITGESLEKLIDRETKLMEV